MNDAMDLQGVKKGLLMVVETTVLSLFTLKAGYDLWKLAKNIENTSIKVEAIADEELPSLTGFDESKDDMEEKTETACTSTMKAQETLELLEAERIDALKSSAVTSSLIAFSGLAARRLIDPSAHLLLLTLLAGIWHMQRKLLVHAYDEGLVKAIERFDQRIGVIFDMVTKHAMICLLHACQYSLRCLSPAMCGASLNDVSVEAEALLKSAVSEARQTNFRELKAAAVVRERSNQERRLTLLKMKTKSSRMSSAF
jgi:hypothetical protein